MMSQKKSKINRQEQGQKQMEALRKGEEAMTELHDMLVMYAQGLHGIAMRELPIKPEDREEFIDTSVEVIIGKFNNVLTECDPNPYALCVKLAVINMAISTVATELDMFNNSRKKMLDS